MAKKDLTFTSKLLINLLAAGDCLSYVIGSPRSINAIWNGKPSSFRSILYGLVRRGVIKTEDKNNKRFIKLTKRGQLEALFEKAKLGTQNSKWDKKWRIIVYDIPEASRSNRALLRQLLKKNHFIKLQISTYIGPYALNREAIKYLRQTKLIEYIRIARVEELDDDRDLRKKFNLR